MKVSELIDKLLNYNQSAEVNVIVHNRVESFSLSFGGGSEGETRKDCAEVSFYVDRLCQNEVAQQTDDEPYDNGTGDSWPPN